MKQNKLGDIGFEEPLNNIFYLKFPINSMTITSITKPEVSVKN